MISAAIYARSANVHCLFNVDQLRWLMIEGHTKIHTKFPVLFLVQASPRLKRSLQYGPSDFPNPLRGWIGYDVEARFES